MRELSLHILDIAENGITAGADCIQIEVNEKRIEDLLTIVIEDNGHGMPAEKFQDPTDPFITTRTTRRVGLVARSSEESATSRDGSSPATSNPTISASRHTKDARATA